MRNISSTIPKELEFRFTEAYRSYLHPAIREAMCLKVQYPESLEPIQFNDLIAGRYKRAAVRFTQHACDELAYTFDENRLRAAAEAPGADEEYKRQVDELISYWRSEKTEAKVRAAYPPEMARKLPSDRWMEEPGTIFPLYRMCGANVNYDKLLRLGIPGMREEVVSYRAKAVERGEATEMFDGMLIALKLLSNVCRHYAFEAERLVRSEPSETRARQLKEMHEALLAISDHKPNSFRQAVQLFWLYSIVSGIRNYGRMDVYLGDFLAADLDAGVLTEAEALEIVQSLWRLIAYTKTTFESRVIIGGVGRRNPTNADRFAMLAMEASRTVLEIEPQLTLRCYIGMNFALLDKALTVIGEGRTYPMLYNDDVNVDAVASAFQVSRSEAEQYVPFGCGEYILDHRSMGTPSGVINLLKLLEITLHNGKDPITGKLMGLQTGEAKDYDSFDQLLAAYKKQAEYAVGVMAEQEELEYRVVGENAAYLYTSMLYDGCLESGKPIFSGGIPYLGGMLEAYGNINTADSLTAIQDLVFEKKQFSLEQLVEMLDADFEGSEAQRQLLLRAPKYGNDNETADTMAKEVHSHICTTIRNQNQRTNLHSYLTVVINNQANTFLGRWTSASADGRKSRQPMANGNTPSGGSDKLGITALLNSIVKLDPTIHAGAVHNLKCSREMFTRQREQFRVLLETYFANGGTQLMISVVNRGDLERAMVEPEKYTHVFVRVGGFSARFVELARDVQEEILSRTIY